MSDAAQALQDIQRRFARWVLGQDDGAGLAGLVEGPGLWVHRNTVRLTLSDALGDLYPVTRQVVGDDFFAQAARLFLRDQPPVAATLLLWGGRFPAFLEELPPAQGLPYLPDLARLEWRRHQALHGPEAPVLTAGDLAALPVDQADALALTLHPTAGLVVSDWPVLDLWQAHQGPDGFDRLRFSPRRQDIVIVRPQAQVLLQALPPGGARFLACLDQGIGPAIARAVEEEPGFNAGALLAQAVSAGWFRRDAAVQKEQV